ncbi:MAG: hypothetical protein CEE42_02485 [Promethearchaeota archaeon Loki_b31]|nr:MAG: hypothetical protein CEE42_02485 [Candidatus Lokiarchaeota archaeon Loki_b31]
MIVLIAAIIAVVLFAGMSVFQLLLVLGLPFGRLAYGGKYEKLPSKMKIISLIGIVIFIFTSLSVLERAEIIIIFNNLMFVMVVVWIIAVYLTFITIMNAISKSKWEKLIMTPISLTLAICCFIVVIVT